MNKKIMTLFARTPVHVGAGNSVGVVDSPVMRERHTRIPIIPGSSLKGVLADLWNDELEKNEKGKLVRKNDSVACQLFGNDDPKNAEAGSLIVGEARVVAFPVRSAKGSFAWITCPLVLSRLVRDTGYTLPELDTAKLDAQSCYGSEDLLLDDSVVLEEYRIKSIDLAEDTAEKLKSLCVDPVWSGITSKLVILSDEMFSYFCENTCDVVSRIKVDDDTGTAVGGALFNQEQVPSETLFYSILFANEKRKADTFELLNKRLTDKGNVVQVGGDASTGLGFCSVGLLDAEVK